MSKKMNMRKLSKISNLFLKVLTNHRNYSSNNISLILKIYVLRNAL